MNSPINKIISAKVGGYLRSDIIGDDFDTTDGVQAFFTLSTLTLAQGEIVSCVDASTGFISSYKWYLNGALISTNTNVDTRIMQLGTNTIKLKVAGGGYTSTYSLEVTSTSGYALDFVSDYSKGESPLDVQFTSTIVGGVAPYAYSWTKTLDGVGEEFSTEANPLETFDSLGIYDITLKVIDDDGIEIELNKNDFIEISDVVVNFVGTPLVGDLPLQINFTNTSSGTIDSYIWEISNDGVFWVAVGTEIDLNYIFNFKGYYSVRLSGIREGVTETETKEDYIKAGGAVRVEQHNFSITNADQAEDFSVTLSNPFLNENLVVEIKSSTGKLVEADGIDITETSIVISFIEYLPEGTFTVTIIGEDLS